MTLHLIPFRPRLTVSLNRLDSTEGESLWLCRAGATSTDAAFVLLLSRFAFRPAAFLCILAGCLRLGFGCGFSALPTNRR
jgi:hypothetical protein